MKNVATITFHASYNYGSNLQAYALQEYIKKLCNNDCIYQIINLRNSKQKEVYELPFGKLDIKSIIKSLILWNYKEQLKKKEINFEKFITTKLNKTEGYQSLEELKMQKFNFDYYISGSDQLWNLKTYDFDWAYYLEFVNKVTKISYAASFGPQKRGWSEQEKSRVKTNLKQYKYISVREEGSCDIVFELTNKKPSINIDPTMLLTKKEWYNIVSKKRLINKDYILLYDLKENRCVYEVAKKLSRKLNLPVIVTKPNKYDFFYKVEKHYDCGPLEFLNLVKNAELVLSTSFHGIVFSVLFNKLFFAIDGDKDLRINTLLKKTRLEDRVINFSNIEKQCEDIFDIDFTNAEKVLIEERKKSETYLKMALDIKE